MKDLTHSGWIKFKGFLFLLLAVASAALLLLEHPDWKTAALLTLCVWACCRTYYFAFYVVERYVDPQFRFSGLGSVVVYLLRRR
jgi:hypothetical protein